MSNAPARSDPIAAVRRFSRFYINHLGLLDEGLLHTDFSLTEARVLFELAHRDAPTASSLGRELGLDPGYLSRILKAFDRHGLITRTSAPHDRRQTLLALTPKGRAAFTDLDRASQQQVGSLLAGLAPAAAGTLVDAMQTIERLVSKAPPLEASDPEAAYRLRPPRLGDIGWIIHRQAILYADEYNWDATFEVLLAEIFANVMKRFDTSCERGWIAERDGCVIGSVFVVRESSTIAKLRLLYVEPCARGLGIGRRLVRECIDFARQNFYTALTLWTNDILTPARRIYAEAGFRCVMAEPQRAFGHDMVSETWELAL